MKRVLLISVCLLVAEAALGQGSVWFRNKITGSGGVDTPFFDDHGVLLEGQGYVAQLFALDSSNALVAVGTPVPFATNGYFFGRDVVIWFVNGCGPATVQVRAWEARGGTTFEQAALAGVWTGVSGVLFLPKTGTPASPTACVEARLIGLEYPGRPVFVRQPHAQTVRAGEAATLSVIASSGVAMFYQWYQGPSGDTNMPIVGATNSTWTTAALATNANFWISVSNYVGSVNSDSAMVSVLPATTVRLSLSFNSGLPSLVIDGALGTAYRIDYTENLSASDWVALTNLTLPTNPFTFVDTQATNSPVRFYRVVAP